MKMVKPRISNKIIPKYLLTFKEIAEICNKAYTAGRNYDDFDVKKFMKP